MTSRGGVMHGQLVGLAAWDAKTLKIAGRAEPSPDEPSRRGPSPTKPSRVEAKTSQAELEPKPSTRMVPTSHAVSTATHPPL